ncbi:hypothetical protein AB1N83_013235 [Pleurotus pulmonarius]
MMRRRFESGLAGKGSCSSTSEVHHTWFTLTTTLATVVPKEERARSLSWAEQYFGMMYRASVYETSPYHGSLYYRELIAPSTGCSIGLTDCGGMKGTIEVCTLMHNQMSILMLYSMQMQISETYHDSSYLWPSRPSSGVGLGSSFHGTRAVRHPTRVCGRLQQSFGEEEAYGFTNEDISARRKHGRSQANSTRLWPRLRTWDHTQRRYEYDGRDGAGCPPRRGLLGSPLGITSEGGQASGSASIRLSTKLEQSCKPSSLLNAQASEAEADYGSWPSYGGHHLAETGRTIAKTTTRRRGITLSERQPTSASSCSIL